MFCNNCIDKTINKNKITNLKNDINILASGNEDGIATMESQVRDEPHQRYERGELESENVGGRK